MATFLVARDSMFATFKTAWDAGAAACVGSNPAFQLSTHIEGGSVAWWMVEPESIPPPNDYWARVSLQSVLEGNASIGGANGGGQQKYSSAGLIFVQCFGPLRDPQVGDKLFKLAIVARNAFRGVVTSANVWFRNARIQPVGSDGTFQIMNAVAEFQFDDVA
jgi:hypothetical protein